VAAELIGSPLAHLRCRSAEIARHRRTHAPHAQPRQAAMRPALNLDHGHCQEIIFEIGSRLRAMLSREETALTPQLERLLQALDDQDRSHSQA
jgi:hypothetical protein